jgi:hypothetical protein
MVTPLPRDTFMKALLSKNPSYINNNQHFMDSPREIRVKKEIRIRWEGDVACMGRTDTHEGVSRGNINERDRLEDLGIHGRLILKLISTQQDERPGTGSICHRRGTSGRLS